MLWLLFLLVWIIGFGVIGLKLFQCDVGSLWFVIIPKSKDLFMIAQRDRGCDSENCDTKII
jgi:hypothetical protein